MRYRIFQKQYVREIKVMESDTKLAIREIKQREKVFRTKWERLEKEKVSGKRSIILIVCYIKFEIFP